MNEQHDTHSNRSCDESSEFSSGSSDTSLLTARIIQLENELRGALSENTLLKDKMEMTQNSLEDEREIKAEMSKANQALSEEIEELSRSLFMEASDMVEQETKARFILEKRHHKLEDELLVTRDQLQAQTAQLNELRHKLQASNSSLTIRDSQNNNTREFGLFSLKYYDDLFPGQKFSSKKRQNCALSMEKSWDTIIKELPDLLFEKFSDFVQITSSFPANKVENSSGKKKGTDTCLPSDERILSHPFLKGILETDVEPCFRFNPFLPIKSRSFLRKLVISLLGNTCCIERLGPNDLDYSAISCSMPTSPSNSQNDSKVKSKKSIKSLLLNLSVTSLPESIVPASTPLDSETDERPLEEIAKIPRCALCKCKLGSPAYRFRLAENDGHGWFSIDSYCRDKIVAVGDLYTFIRHIRRGLFTHRPIADLYCELMHYLRNIFYVRIGATSFFIRNDIELLYSKLLSNAND